MAKNAMGTTMYHLVDRLLPAIEGLHNNVPLPGATLAREYIGNPIARNMQGLSDYDVRSGRFETAKTAVLDEATKVFAGTSGGVFDRAKWESKINAADSTAKQKAVVQELVGLMKGRMEQLASTWNETMKPQEQLTAYGMMSPDTAMKVKKVLGEGVADKKADVGGVGKATPEQSAALLDEARGAIAKGKSRAAVIQRLQAMGVDPAGL